MGGLRGGSTKREQLVLDLPQLQNLIKRDPVGYKDEFEQQYRNYLSELDIFLLKPTKASDRFAELATFVSHVAICYKKQCELFPTQLSQLLEQHGASLTPDLRMKLVQALILLRNRGLLEPLALLTLFFKLFRVQDKALRQLLFEHIVNDVKNTNQKARNDGLNRSLQNFMYSMLKDESEVAAKKSLDVMVELYRKRVWTDARTVNVIATALESDSPRLRATALNFFLNIDGKMADDENEEEGDLQPQEVDRHEHSKKTAKRARHAAKQEKANKKKLLKQQTQEDKEGLFPAINLLNDPQATAEKVFKRLRQSNERFELKLLMMNFVSRVVGAHKLLLLQLYSYLQRYIMSHQREVTHILAYLVQACHDLVPPDEVLPVVKAIAQNFITDRCSGDLVALGINTVREVVKRVPALLDEPDCDGLVQDLAAYSKSRDKSIIVAARTFINTVRALYPALLKGKDRGREHDISARPLAYGAIKVLEGVEGAELLQLYEQGVLQLNSDDELVEGNNDGSQAGKSDASDEEWEDSDGEEPPQLVSLNGADPAEAGEEDVEAEGEDEDGGSAEELFGDEESDGEEEEGESSDEEEEEDADDDNLTEASATKSASSGGDPENTKGSSPKSLLKRKRTESSADQMPQSGRLDAKRILTAEDFEKIKKLKAAVHKASLDPRNRRKRKLPSSAGPTPAGSDSEEEAPPDHMVNPSQLEGFKKRRRATLEERLESVLLGREKFKKQKHPGGLTNLEKERKKNFLMVRKSRQLKEKTKRAAKQVNRSGKQNVKKLLKRDRRKKRRT